MAYSQSALRSSCTRLDRYLEHAAEYRELMHKSGEVRGSFLTYDRCNPSSRTTLTPKSADKDHIIPSESRGWIGKHFDDLVRLRVAEFTDRLLEANEERNKEFQRQLKVGSDAMLSDMEERCIATVRMEFGGN